MYFGNWIVKHFFHLKKNIVKKLQVEKKGSKLLLLVACCMCMQLYTYMFLFDLLYTVVYVE